VERAELRGSSAHWGFENKVGRCEVVILSSTGARLRGLVPHPSGFPLCIIDSLIAKHVENLHVAQRIKVSTTSSFYNAKFHGMQSLYIWERAS